MTLSSPAIPSGITWFTKLLKMKTQTEDLAAEVIPTEFSFQSLRSELALECVWVDPAILCAVEKS